MEGVYGYEYFNKAFQTPGIEGLSDVIIAAVEKFEGVKFRLSKFGEGGCITIELLHPNMYGYKDTTEVMLDGPSLSSILPSDGGKRMLTELIEDILTEWIKSLEYCKKVELKYEKKQGKETQNGCSKSMCPND